MTRRRLLSHAQRAAKYAGDAMTRIQLAEVTGGRAPNWELELALAYLAGSELAMVAEVPEPKP